MLRYEAHSSADVATVWALYARPGRWHEWAPQLGGAWGLGHPEVVKGSRGAARLLGVLPVPARITAVAPGRRWSWRVGLVAFDHRVDPAPGGGSIVGVDLRAAPGVEAVLKLSYGPLCALLMKNLARVAAAQPQTS